LATYVVGDIHGCFLTLERLLRELPFRAGRDHLWLTGDLVNRGPSSLEVLRWAEATSRALGERFVAVLGNHDLHLLATAAGFGRAHHRAALRTVLAAPDAESLLAWLARRPLAHRRDSTILVHAGLFPEWTIFDAEERARALEEALADDRGRRTLFASFAESNMGMPRDLYGFTALRTLRADGEPCDFNGPPEQAPAGCLPWFALSEGRSDATVVAGHWAALGLCLEDHFLGLDTGCVYGGALTAIRLEDRKVFSVANSERSRANQAMP